MKRVPDLKAEFLRCYKDRRCRHSRGMLTTTILFTLFKLLLALYFQVLLTPMTVQVWIGVSTPRYGSIFLAKVVFRKATLQSIRRLEQASR